MRNCLYIFIAICFIACTKTKDTVYTFVCTSSYQKDPFTLIKKDTTFYNITTADAVSYARSTSVNGWVTDCERQ